MHDSMRPTAGTAEHRRLAAADTGREAWRHWGPYVAERAWGTVREDYSADGDPWRSFPHDQARSRAYRWTEDGLAGFCDEGQTWCLGLALWNEVDPILKERLFGLSGPEGNHGEDVKEHWWYLDATPTHSWQRWLYHYPQREFPYAELVTENARRGRDQPEYELTDTDVFADDRFWEVTVDYAKGAPDDLLMRVTVHNRGPDPARLHVLPTVWLRNTWAWGLPGQDDAPVIEQVDGHLVVRRPRMGPLTLAGNGEPELLFCDNETNAERLFGAPGRSAYPKDGINDHIVHGLATVNPARRGTKAALHYVITVPPGSAAELRLRLCGGETPGDLDAAFARIMAQRQGEADEFYAELTPPGTTPRLASVLRQALAGMLWSKQFYHFDVERWLAGDPAGPPAPPRQNPRNRGWKHLNNHDVISVPDKWEYPWYAAWDLAFHCLPLAWVDPTFAKEQLLLLCREWYMHPNGELPAYEWNFGDVNPPVQAWAARRVFEIDGSRDYAFLERVFQKLLLNFTWWVNREDRAGNNVFQGGFLGLDNIGPFDRSSLPVPGYLEQSDGTGWMAMYCLNMLDLAIVLARHDVTYEDMATKFFEHFAYIASAAQELWDDSDGFFYDVLTTEDSRRFTLRIRSLAGLLPLCATTTLDPPTLERLPYFASHLQWFLANKAEYAMACTPAEDGSGRLLLSVVRPDQVPRILARLLDEGEFLSDHGLRALSRSHAAEPFVLSVDGITATVGYEPGESETGLFGGNSNWRGPVWFPANYLLLEALERLGEFHGARLTVDVPTGSGPGRTVADAANELTRRLVSLFLADQDAAAPTWFFEYFHGDTGAGLGASHQTGWTGLVADLILRRGPGS
jgi:hypothetical protein